MSPSRVRIGTTFLLAAQGTFLVSGYFMHIILGRYLGPVEYGMFGVVLYAATMIRTFVASGLPMAVARFVSAEPDNAEAIFRKGMILQFFLSITVSLIFFLAAPYLADLLGDSKLTILFQIVAPITIFFGIFFLVIQYYNGLRRYFQQSLWLTISYLLRAGLAIGLAVVGFRVFGAVAGLVIAIAIACAAALITRPPEEKTESFPGSRLIQFSVPLIIASISQALLTDLDLMFVKRLVVGDASTGYYTSAKALAQVTPFAFYALSGALYPAVSSAYSSGDTDKLKRYIKQANRLLIMVILPLVLWVSWDSEAIISLFFSDCYIPGAFPLRWLMLSFSLMAIFIIHKTIITGCGFPKISSILTVSLLPICVISQFSLIPIYGLTGAAVASMLTFLLGTCCSFLVIYLKFRAGFYAASSLRIIASAIFTFAVDVLLTSLEFPLIPKLILLVLLYAAVLRLFGEWRTGMLKEFAGQFFQPE